MAEVTIKYLGEVPAGDPQSRPCRIIGKLANLRQVSFSQVSGYLAPRVDETVKAKLSYVYKLLFSPDLDKCT